MTMYLHCIIGDLSMRLAGVAALGLVLLQHILPLCPPCNTIPGSLWPPPSALLPYEPAMARTATVDTLLQDEQFPLRRL
jgi:hypothetical protein